MNEWMNALCIVRNISSVWNLFYLINSFVEQMFEWRRFALFFLNFCCFFPIRMWFSFSFQLKKCIIFCDWLCVVWLLFVYGKNEELNGMWYQRRSVRYEFQYSEFRIQIFSEWKWNIYLIICSTNFNPMKMFHVRWAIGIFHFNKLPFLCPNNTPAPNNMTKLPGILHSNWFVFQIVSFVAE